jgi:outer membrane lipoprotein carrier protein
MNAWMLAAWLLAAAAPSAQPVAPKPAVAAPRPASSAAPSTAAAATSPQVRALVDRVQAFYERTQDFEARFTQRYAYATSHRTQVSTGEVKFKKPGLMRWDYQMPSKRTFLLTGDRAYALDPEALTLTKSPVDENQLSAAVTFLWGKGKLADEFNIAEQTCKKCQGLQLVLTPKKPDPRFQRILLEVDPKTAQVLRSTVVDPDGSVNEITFEGLKTNVKLTEAQFKLNPPPNTQILDMTQKH